MRVIAAARSATRAQTDMAVRQLVPRSASGGAGYWAGSGGGGERDGRAAPSAPPWQVRRGVADLSAGACGIELAASRFASAFSAATASEFKTDRRHEGASGYCLGWGRPAMTTTSARNSLASMLRTDDSATAVRTLNRPWGEQCRADAR